MPYLNVIDWHVHLAKVERFLEGWLPAIERALAYGATSSELSRSEDDPNHLVQHSVWEDKGDFDRYWQGAELQGLREGIAGTHNVLVLPHWHVVMTQAGSEAAGSEPEDVDSAVSAAPAEPS